MLRRKPLDCVLGQRDVALVDEHLKPGPQKWSVERMSSLAEDVGPGADKGGKIRHVHAAGTDLLLIEGLREGQPSKEVRHLQQPTEREHAAEVGAPNTVRSEADTAAPDRRTWGARRKSAPAS